MTKLNLKLSKEDALAATEESDSDEQGSFRTGVDAGEMGKNWNDTFKPDEPMPSVPDDSDEGDDTPGSGALSIPVAKTKIGVVSVEGQATQDRGEEEDSKNYVGIKLNKDF
jgi:hypothetical protein